MRLNTRNFFLYLLAVAFLVIAITVTALPPAKSSSQVSTVVVGDEVSDDTEFTAIASDTNTLNRAVRVSELKQKIAALPPLEAPLQASSDTSEDKPTITADVNDFVPESCPASQLAVLTWPTVGLQLGVVEGARLLYAEVPSELDLNSADKVVYLQLPLQTGTPRNFGCVPYDVIGVATDGSLIRNTEVSLYRIFEAETLLGYALDGFPIYGTSATLTDVCGGVAVDGQYRYYLSTSRDTIIGCFAGLPVEL